MRAHRLVPLVLALLVAPSAAATHAEDGLPFSAAVVDARAAALDALAAAPEDAARFANATADWAASVDAVRGLTPRAADVLAGYYEALTGDARGNASDVKSLARAASHAWRQDVRPAVAAWEAEPTFVTVGAPEAARERAGVARVPLVLVHPPAGGVGAFDVHASVTGGRIVDATLETGQGEKSVDAVNGTARLAAFDAKALGGLGSASTSLVLGWVLVEPAVNGTLDGVPPLVVVRVGVTEIADAEGTRVPAVGVTRHVDALTAVDAAGTGLGGLRIGIIAAGAAAAAGAMFLVRKLVKV